jgi:uncharacterized membrane protein
MRDPSKIFENLILILIVISSLTLVIDTPLLDPNGTYSQVINKLDMTFTFLFLIEALIKIIALGFIKNYDPH